MVIINCLLKKMLRFDYFYTASYQKTNIFGDSLRLLNYCHCGYIYEIKNYEQY